MYTFIQFVFCRNGFRIFGRLQRWFQLLRLFVFALGYYFFVRCVSVACVLVVLSVYVNVTCASSISLCSD